MKKRIFSFLLTFACTNAAKVVSGRYTGIAGGICGYARDSEFYNCHNTASVISKCTAWGGVSVAGGVVGMAYKKDNKSNVTVSTNSCSGGSAYIKAENYGNGISWTHVEHNIIGHEMDWER